ncbi:MAG: hypothetical protein WBM46_18590 [Polyangiales bacterium]|jgi:hypothetical protein
MPTSVEDEHALAHDLHAVDWEVLSVDPLDDRRKRRGIERPVVR